MRDLNAQRRPVSGPDGPAPGQPVGEAGHGALAALAPAEGEWTRDEHGALVRTDFRDLPLRSRGKVRDVYDLGEHLLFVATDRISAFDWVLPNGIPDKGAVLTQLSLFWFGVLGDLVPTHLAAANPGADPRVPTRYHPVLAGRAMVVEKAEVFPVECVARGYLAGSGWKDYQRTGAVCGIVLPAGLRQASRLPAAIFTPATKAESGHDETMTYAELITLVGNEAANAVRLRSLALYNYASAYAAQRGIIISDTKFEFGFLDGEPIVIDEMLTPDSSRFWLASDWNVGAHQEAFDKQYVRDWLLASDWNREPPGPELPADVIEETSRLYREIYKRLTGEEVRL